MGPIRNMFAAAIAVSAIALTAAPAAAESKFACQPGDTYIMNVMVSAHPYWVPVFEGFKQAATAMGCEVIGIGDAATQHEPDVSSEGLGQVRLNRLNKRGVRWDDKRRWGRGRPLIPG